MKITEEMVRRAMTVVRGIQHRSAEDYMRHVLEAALAEVPEPLSKDALSTGERRDVELSREMEGDRPNSDVMVLVGILDRIAPKPAPAVKTVEELEMLVRSEFNMATPRALDALDELVRRANGQST